MSSVCGAVLARVRKAQRGLPKAESALCFLSLPDRSEAGAAIAAKGGTVTHEFGWAERSALAAHGGPEDFVRAPSRDLLGLAAAFSLVFAHEVDAAATWDAWLEGEPAELALALGLRCDAGLTRPLRFIRTRADAEEFLLRNALPCLPLGARESIEFRERWRAGHLTPEALAQREPGKPRGSRSGRWTYDWDALVRAEDVEPARALARLAAQPGDRTALFFEAADLPVFLVPKAYLERRPVDWECDVYWTGFPDPAGSAVWDHEGYGPRWSMPSPV